MLKLCALSLLAIVQASAADTGWIDLLKSNSLKGWTRIAIPPDHPVNAQQQWTIDKKAHTLHCSGDQGHEWLRYDARQFDNFEYHAEWRFDPVTAGTPKYNSGVFFRNDADGKIWHQAQVNNGNGGYIFADTMVHGELKRVNTSKQMKGKFEKPAGEWNVYDIRCESTHCSLTVNGQFSSEIDLEVTRGYLGVESEGYHITFRNLRAHPLP